MWFCLYPTVDESQKNLLFFKKFVTHVTLVVSTSDDTKSNMLYIQQIKTNKIYWNYIVSKIYTHSIVRNFRKNTLPSIRGITTSRPKSNEINQKFSHTKYSQIHRNILQMRAPERIYK